MSIEQTPDTACPRWGQFMVSNPVQLVQRVIDFRRLVVGRDKTIVCGSAMSAKPLQSDTSVAGLPVGIGLVLLGQRRRIGASILQLTAAMIVLAACSARCS